MADPPEMTTAADISIGSGGGKIQAKLVILNGPDEGRELPVVSRIVVGSDSGAHLVLNDRKVSRRHAEFSVSDGNLMVRDLGSRNGTFVGYTRVIESQVLLGSVVQLGDTSLAVRPRWYVREVAPSKSRRFGELVGGSLRMRETFAILERVASTDVTVLLEGESGTGKDLAARSLHAASSRADRPFVVFDCASVPRELAESELFGHRRGSFSGAVADRTGAFQEAHEGTIFLDELGELPPELQPKLLRVLETGSFRRVGDDAMRSVDVRVIAATNRDLAAEVRRGRFRADLWYRLEVVQIRLPALRERLEDVPELVKHVLSGKRAADDSIEGENLTRLMAYSWPGNVRELRNVLERAVALARPEHEVRFRDLVLNLEAFDSAPSALGPAFPGVASALPFKQAKELLLQSFERAYVDALLARHKGNLTQAAAAAELSRKHLYDLIRKYGSG